MKLRLILFLAALAVLPLSGCKQTYKWHQKLTLTVETPEGDRSGSAVTRVSATVGRQFPTGQDTILTQGFAGEATVVDLGAGKYLFAILSVSGGNATTNLADHTFAPFVKIDRAQDEISRLNAKYGAFETLRGARAIPIGAYPSLVRFLDINNPKSVKLVDPANLAASFGRGYQLKSITLEITEEAVSVADIQKVLTWIQGYFDKHFDGNTIETISARNRLANSLTSGNFTTWRN